MNPHEQFCHNKDCRAYAREGEGHIVIHSQKERRYRCKRCRRTFTQTTGTALYRLHKPKELMFTVITLLAHGCALQAVVAVFGVDERTVARWEREAGVQCQRVHEHIVEAGRVELGQVQADELRVRVVGGVMWLAGALAGHRWSVEELLSFCVPPAEIPKWRGRRPKWLVEAACAA